MITYCEFYSKTVLPALRALVAKELIEKYSMTQMEVANMLGVTQALINYYLHGKRRKKEIELIKEVPEVREAATKLSKALAEKKFNEVRVILCNLCTKLRSNERSFNKLLKILGYNPSSIIMPLHT